MIEAGQIYRARRGTRLWRVTGERTHLGEWWLDPLGNDVQAARSPTTGKFQGGVRRVSASEEALTGKGWHRVE